MKAFTRTLSAGLILAAGASLWLRAQEQERPTFRVKVDMVVLGFTVIDNKGKYVNGLKPTDFKVYEDEIPQKLNTFAEGDHPPMLVMDDGSHIQGSRVGKTTMSRNRARLFSARNTKATTVHSSSRERSRK